MNCNDAEKHYYDYIENAFDAIEPSCLEHIRSCPTCRERVEQFRLSLAAESGTFDAPTHTMLALHLRLLDRWVDCEQVKPFLPCLAMRSLPVRCQTPVTVHLDACSTCRADAEKITSLGLCDSDLAVAGRYLADAEPLPKELSEKAEWVLSGIRRRPMSGVQTCATFEGGDETKALQVQTRRADTVRPTKYSRRSLAAVISGAAAAAILFAVLLIVSPPSLEALELRQLYNSLGEAMNVHICIRVPDQQEPLQQIWISRSAGVVLIETPPETVLYDLRVGQMVTREHLDAPITTKPVSTLPKFVEVPWGLLPFKDIRQLREGYVWERVDDRSDAQTMVYALRWSEGEGMMRIDKTWMGFVDRQTHLLQSVEWYEKIAIESSPRLMTRYTVTYPSTAEVLEAVDALKLRPTQGDQR